LPHQPTKTIQLLKWKNDCVPEFTVEIKVDEQSWRTYEEGLVLLDMELGGGGKKKKNELAWT